MRYKNNCFFHGNNCFFYANNRFAFRNNYFHIHTFRFTFAKKFFHENWT